MVCHMQGDHSPDNVKFPDGSRHSSAALGNLSVTHIMPVLLSVVAVGMQQCMIQTTYLILNTCMDTNMQFTINSFRQLFPDKFFSLTFSKIPDSCQIPWHFQVYQASGHLHMMCLSQSEWTLWKVKYLVIVALHSSHVVSRNWNWFWVIDDVVFKWRVWR